MGSKAPQPVPDRVKVANEAPASLLCEYRDEDGFAHRIYIWRNCGGPVDTNAVRGVLAEGWSLMSINHSGIDNLFVFRLKTEVCRISQEACDWV